MLASLYASLRRERAFASKNGTERLVLELFRSDGMQQAVVLLDPPPGR